MSISYWLDKKEKPTHQYDITIIGGGVAGLSTAYWLLKEDPSLNICLIEKNRLGFGATGRNAGFITCGSVEHFNRLVGKHGPSEAQNIWRFSETNLELLKQEIFSGHEDQIYFEQAGTYSLATTHQEFSELQESAAIMQKMDIKVEVVDQLEIQKQLNAIGFVGGINYQRDGSVHPLLMLGLIKEKILKLKPDFEFFTGHEVYAINDQAENKLIKTDNGNFLTPILVMATNAYSDLIHPWFKNKIFPTKGQILMTEPLNKRIMQAPCYCNFVLDYFRQLPSREILIGGFRQLQKNSEIGHSDNVTGPIQEALADFLDKHIPLARGKEITHRWSGIMGFSTDGQPMVGSLPTDPQTFFLGGFTAHGLGLAFHCAKALVDSMYDRPIPAWLSAKRFS